MFIFWYLKLKKRNEKGETTWTPRVPRYAYAWPPIGNADGCESEREHESSHSTPFIRHTNQVWQNRLLRVTLQFSAFPWIICIVWGNPYPSRSDHGSQFLQHSGDHPRVPPFHPKGTFSVDDALTWWPLNLLENTAKLGKWSCIALTVPLPGRVSIVSGSSVIWSTRVKALFG